MDLMTDTDTMKNASVIWSDIPEYKDLYEVSNKGEVRRKGKTKCLKPVVTSGGYQQVTLSRNNKRVSKFVHRLVAISFVDGDTSLSVNHIDGKQAEQLF